MSKARLAVKLKWLAAAALLFAGAAGAFAQTGKQDELKKAVREASDNLNGKIPKGNKIVVLNVQSDFAALSDYVISELIANAVSDGVFIAVDRQQIDAIQAEQEFQMSGAVDDNDALAIGKFFGAQTIVSGAVSNIGDGHRLSVRALDVQTTQVQAQFNRDIKSSKILNSLIRQREEQKRLATAHLPEIEQEAAFGMKFGLNFPGMGYSDKGLSGYSGQVYATGVFELFGQYEIIPSLSVRPGMKFIRRGQHIKNDFTYKLDADYTEFTVPAAYTFKEFRSVYPYAMLGPALGFARGGEISYKTSGSTSYKTKVNKSNISSTAFGLFIAAGVKYPLAVYGYPIVPGFEIGYHLGLSDTYSKKETSEEANALNAYIYDINGSRGNRGLEFGLTLSVPFMRYYNAVSSKFKKAKAPEPEPVPEPVAEPLPPPPEPEKICYTIDEMKELILNEQDIRGKKICAIKQVSFKLGSHELTAEDKVYLDEMVILMQTNELISVRVNGHTDNVGNEESNTSLSRERAKAVHDYLLSKGIAQPRLSYAYFGSRRPIADNDTEEGRAINRRVEFEINNQ